MATLVKLLPTIQIIISVLLVGAVLLQRPVSDAGALGNEGLHQAHVKRGLEKTLYQATIVLAVIFAASAFFALLV